MAVKLRLSRAGSKKRPFYRIVAIQSGNRRDGRPLELLGTYNPMVEPPVVKLDMDKAQKWLDEGAKASNTVKSLIKGYEESKTTVADE